MSLRIDRASFLSLTFGMAGLACNTGPGPTVAANVVDIPPQPASPADAGAAVAVAPSPPEAATTPRAVPDHTPPDEEDDDVVGFNVAEGGGGANPTQACGLVDVKTVTRPTAPCRDDQGTAPSCAVMKTCSGFAFPREHCESNRRFMKPKVAERALGCLAKLSTKQTCDDACTSYRCTDLALKTACPDPTADADCMQITTKCRSVSMTDCRMYMSGLNAAGRTKLMACLTSKSGCGFGLFSCSESL